MRLGFVNYVRRPTRETPINAAAARFVLGGYLIWKTVWYDWNEVLETPFLPYQNYSLLIPESATLLIVEKYLLVVTLFAFILGYRLRLSAFVSALLVGHLGVVRYVYNTSGGVTSLFIASYFLVFFGLYHHRSELSLDGVRRTRNEQLSALVTRLKSSARGTYRMDTLRWNLLIFAVIYFGSGFDKLLQSGPAWIGSENLSRIIVVQSFLYEQTFVIGSSEVATPFGVWMVQYPELVWASTIGTLVVELGLLPAALLGVSITPLVVGLYGMTTVIWLTMGILFGDVYFFVAMFFTWDVVYERVVRDRELDLVFDERCFFCARSLYLFKLLDVNDTVSFYTQSDAPARYRNRDGVDFEDAMYVFDDGTAHRGYGAFRRLLDQFRVFTVVVWLMRRSPVEQAGERVYRYVADNRSRYFVCGVDADG